MPLTHEDDLIQLQIDQARTNPVDMATNGAPAGEPETWDPTIPAFNPLLAHTPEPEPLSVSPDLAADLTVLIVEDDPHVLLGCQQALALEDIPSVGVASATSVTLRAVASCRRACTRSSLRWRT